MNIVCCPYAPAPIGCSKMQNGCFLSISALHLKKVSAAKFLCVNTVSNKAVWHSLAYLAMQKWLVVDVPIYLKFCPKLTQPFKNADFLSIFARSVSAVTSSKKSSINTNRKFITRFPMSTRWTAKGAQNVEWPFFLQKLNTWSSLRVSTRSFP